MDDDFQRIGEVLGDALFASYLLGYDLAKDESNTIASFAEGDDIADEAGPIQLRFDVPPEEAIDYFKRKKVLPSKTFYDIRDEARDAAFTVSGIYRQDVLEAFRQEIEDALRVGWSQQKVVKNFKEILAGAGHRELGDFHLETVFRTNMQMAYGVGRRKQMEETAELLPFWQYSAVNDDRTRPTHRALDGIVLPANHHFWDEHYPPWAFNCFLPGTKIEGRIERGFRSWYQGKVVEITTRSGNRMTVTANHPVLTVQGFAPAQSLNQGDNVLSYLDRSKPRLDANCRSESLVGISGAIQTDVFSPNENIHNQPLAVEQVFSALLQFGNVSRFPIAANDFHGDAMFGNGYVEVVNANRKLCNSLKAKRFYRTQDSFFSSVDSDSAVMGSDSSFDSRFKSILTSTSGLPSSTTLSSNSVRSLLESLPLNFFLVGTASQLDAKRTKFSSDSGTRESEFAAQLQDRYATFVALDEIVHIRDFDFCGHVYDFQTEGGWIVANGIFTSNCRCTVIALPEMPEDYNHELPNPDSQISYDKNGMPIKAQYGTGVYDLSAGKFTGVPRQTGLKKTIEDVAKRTYKTPKEVFKTEDKIRDDVYENAIVFNRDGKQIWSKVGTRDRVRVQFTEKEKAKVKGGIITHNHPANTRFDKADPRYDGGGFSTEDVEIAAFYGMIESRAVSQAYRYSIVAEEGWDNRINQYVERTKISIIEQMYLDIRDMLLRKLRAMVLRKYKSDDAIKKALAKAEVEAEHQTWKALAKEFGFIYRREQR